jgi:glycosyltransferase involved in cell wall biosynthesis
VVSAQPVRVHALVDNLGSGGAEFLLADLAAVAPGAGIELSVATLKPMLSPSPAADRLRGRGVEPRHVQVTSMIGARDGLRLRTHLERVRPDLVHTHLGTSDFLGGIAARSLGLPSVATIHADWWPRGRRDRAKTWLSSRARRHCAKVVIAVSDSARSAYLNGGRDAPEHVVVVRNGIADRARPGSGPAVRLELGLDPGDLVVTALSKLRPEKNFETSVAAVALLRERLPRVRLVIAGDGPHAEVVRRHAGRLQKCARVVGHREDVMALLDATDVLIHPSHFDAFPTSLLEAMSASVPVVATATGGMLEIVEHGSTGVLVDPPPAAEAFAAALEPLLADATLRRRLGEAGRARYEREFTAQSWALRLRGVYDQVLATG